MSSDDAGLVAHPRSKLLKVILESKAEILKLKALVVKLEQEKQEVLKLAKEEASRSAA